MRSVDITKLICEASQFQQGGDRHGIARRCGVVLQVARTGDQGLVVVASIEEAAFGRLVVGEYGLGQFLSSHEPAGIEGCLV